MFSYEVENYFLKFPWKNTLEFLWRLDWSCRLLLVGELFLLDWFYLSLSTGDPSILWCLLSGCLFALILQFFVLRNLLVGCYLLGLISSFSWVCLWWRLGCSIVELSFSMFRLCSRYHTVLLDLSLGWLTDSSSRTPECMTSSTFFFYFLEVFTHCQEFLWDWWSHTYILFF